MPHCRVGYVRFFFGVPILIFSFAYLALTNFEVQGTVHRADGQRNCPKHVEFYSKNKLEKLVHLVGFVIRMGLNIVQVTVHRDKFL